MLLLILATIISTGPVEARVPTPTDVYRMCERFLARETTVDSLRVKYQKSPERLWQFLERSNSEEDFLLVLAVLERDRNYVIDDVEAWAHFPQMAKRAALFSREVQLRTVKHYNSLHHPLIPILKHLPILGRLTAEDRYEIVKRRLWDDSEAMLPRLAKFAFTEYLPERRRTDLLVHAIRSVILGTFGTLTPSIDHLWRRFKIESPPERRRVVDALTGRRSPPGWMTVSDLLIMGRELGADAEEQGRWIFWFVRHSLDRVSELAPLADAADIVPRPRYLELIKYALEQRQSWDGINEVGLTAAEKFKVLRLLSYSRDSKVKTIAASATLPESNRVELLNSMLDHRHSLAEKIDLVTSAGLSDSNVGMLLQGEADADIEKFIETATGLKLDDFPVIRDAKAEMDLVRILETVSRRFPMILPQRWTTLMFDHVLVRETGLRLLRKLSRDRAAQVAEVDDSRQLVARAIGLPPDFLNRSQYAEGALRQFYAYAFDLLDRNHPVFALSTVDGALGRQRDLAALNDLLLAMRTADQMQDRDHGRRRLTKVDVGNIEEIIASFRKSAADHFSRLFPDETASRQGLSSDQVELLRGRWGSLEAVRILAARFQGNAEWRMELPVLGRIFRASLAGDFGGYKFGGYPGDAADQKRAAQQLSSLTTDHSRRTWRTDRVALHLPDDGVVLPSRADLLESFRTTLRYNLIPHLGYTESRTSVAISGGTKETPPQLLKRLLDAPSRTPALVRDDLVANMTTETSPDRLTQLAATLLMLIEKHPDTVADDQRDQARSDLRTLRDTFIEPDVSKQVILATTLTSDPLLMLTIGELVRQASCQSYRVGSHAETLPAYVIDANVRAIVTFALRPTDFPGDDFKALRRIDLQRGDLVAKFDGNQRVFTIQTGGRTFVTRPLEHAHLRQILKLGENSRGGPGLAFEPAYGQSHPLAALMKNAHLEMAASLASDLNASLGETVTMAPSRNRRGIYSDRAGGVNTSSYVLKTPKTE